MPFPRRLLIEGEELVLDLRPHPIALARAILLTLLGVKAIAEGVTYTLFPAVMPAMLGWYESRRRTLFPVIGVVTIIIGLIVLREWWQYMHSSACIWHPCFNQAWNK